LGALPRTIEGRAIANQAGLMSESKIRPLLNEASEIVAIMASSKKTASRSTWQSQIANRKSQIP
jgi:hypothetical protein